MVFNPFRIGREIGIVKNTFQIMYKFKHQSKKIPDYKPGGLEHA